MNFFGHAVVATWRTESPVFALGAMLPDWAGMCGARLGPVGGALGAGVAFHHETDRVFHALPAFRALERRAIETLRARGVDRGPARGAAHVAVELLLDGVLVTHEPTAGPLYLAALAAAPDHRAAHGDDRRMDHLIARLHLQGLPHAYQDPTEVARRTARALATRPRLALDDRAHHHLAETLPALAHDVAEATHGLLADLRRHLA